MDNNQPESQKTHSQQFEEESLRERLRFEGLISDFLASFVGVSSEEVEGEINKWLQRITEFFGADRCTLRLFSEDGTQ